MKKVLLVATVQSHICQFHRPLCALLRENGFEIHVAARNNLAEKNGLKLDFADKVYDIAFNRSPFSSKNVDAYKVLKKIIDENNYSHVHCNTPVGGFLSRLICKNKRKDGLKVFYTAHGFHFYSGSSKLSWLIYYPIEKFLARYTDKIITIANEDYNTAIDRKFKSKICRIHGVGANSEKYSVVDADEKSKLRKQENLDDDDFVCVCAGELLPNKNQSTLIKAAKLVIKDIPNFRLLLAGNGPMDENLKALIAELGLERHVKMIGYRIDLERFMLLSDFVVSASIREGLGLNLIEAMLCGKPVIGSKNRGHNELINDDENGLRVDAMDEKGFAHAFKKIYSNSELYSSMCENALIIAKGYTKESVKLELKEIYEI